MVNSITEKLEIEKLPKLRFPGFSGGWEEKELEKVKDGSEVINYKVNNLVTILKSNLLSSFSVIEMLINREKLLINLLKKVEYFLGEYTSVCKCDRCKLIREIRKLTKEEKCT